MNHFSHIVFGLMSSPILYSCICFSNIRLHCYNGIIILRYNFFTALSAHVLTLDSRVEPVNTEISLLGDVVSFMVGEAASPLVRRVSSDKL